MKVSRPVWEEDDGKGPYGTSSAPYFIRRGEADVVGFIRRRPPTLRKTARALILSSDMIAYENLQIANMVKNHALAKSISDASWGLFLSWLGYYGHMAGIPVVAVSPRFTTQDCSSCGYRVQKTLSMRTHVCPNCGLMLDRDHNAALNILLAAPVLLAALNRTAGQAETGAVSAVHNASGQTASTAVFARARHKRAG